MKRSRGDNVQHVQSDTITWAEIRKRTKVIEQWLDRQQNKLEKKIGLPALRQIVTEMREFR